MAFPEPIKPLGKKEAESFLESLDTFALTPRQKEHFRRLRDGLAEKPG